MKKWIKGYWEVTITPTETIYEYHKSPVLILIILIFIFIGCIIGMILLP